MSNLGDTWAINELVEIAKKSGKEITHGSVFEDFINGDIVIMIMDSKKNKYQKAIPKIKLANLGEIGTMEFLHLQMEELISQIN